MKTFRRTYLITVLLFSITGYIFVLGDAGYIKRQNLHRQLDELERTVAELQEENRLLNERYGIIREKEQTEQSGHSLREEGSAIILKFEQESEGNMGISTNDANPAVGLKQMRIYYLFTSGFLMAIGLLLLRDRQPMTGVANARDLQSSSV